VLPRLRSRLRLGRPPHLRGSLAPALVMGAAPAGPALPRSWTPEPIERSWAAGRAGRPPPPGGRTGQDPPGLRLSQVLGRDEVDVGGERARRLVSDRRVLVTGAGGAVGSALCRRLAALGPAVLCMVDHDAGALDRLRLEVGGAGRPPSAVQTDVRDRDAVAAAVEGLRPQIVFHAAQCRAPAELELNPCAGVLTNVRGAHHVVAAAVRCGVERFALVSTDTAADPASVFGATKRLAELLLQVYAGGATRFATVRIGDVLGAPGSLLAAVADRLAGNKTITIGHPDLARRFMTAEESAGLVLEATALAAAAETFALDLGDPVPAVDVVHRYAEQLRVPAVSIRFGGLGPGEKLTEEAFAAAERPVPTEHPRMLATGRAPVPACLPRLFDSLYLMAAHGDEESTRLLLRRLLPEYHPERRP
jgi:FlaA1/EpsC-like NDP-sugar epimerase